ncbi:DUF2085 domain-containing protein [Anaerotignum sp.]|uniref:DUF2085 domain-containing protein n=1 Tax=Anaerotignum sp. TaxID=2039241 RepID=UPI0028AC53B1|nr:DUF2085 domain-containing protein [Anaerotignum sp.]
MAERSFILGGMTLPVCARCTGIYSGIFFSMVFFLIFRRLDGNCPYSTKGLIMGTFAFIPISIDGFFSYMGFWESNQLMRVVTGALAGSSLIGFLLLGANFDVKAENAKPIFRGEKEQLLVISSTLAWGILIWMNVGSYLISSAIIVFGVLCFWANIIYLILKNLATNKSIPFWLLSFGGSFIIVLSIGVLR